jgi:hypothetical protein
MTYRDMLTRWRAEATGYLLHPETSTPSLRLLAVRVLKDMREADPCGYVSTRVYDGISKWPRQ